MAAATKPKKPAVPAGFKTAAEYNAYVQKFKADPQNPQHLGPQAYARSLGMTYGGTPWFDLPKAQQEAARARDFAAGSMPGSYRPASEAGQLNTVNAALGTSYDTLAEAKGALELPSMFAGREQYMRNLRGEGGEALPNWLRNVQSENPRIDDASWNLLLGNIQNQGANMRNVLDQWNQLVPDWAPSVRDQLLAMPGGIPFRTELLNSPEINLNDPSKPLFGAKDSPISLFQLTGNQEGERGFYRSLTAPELMTSIAPMVERYFHRPAGAPIPTGYEGGFTFGSPFLNPSGDYTFSAAMGVKGGPQQIGSGMLGTYFPASEHPDAQELVSQLAGNLYNRWSAYGMPGQRGMPLTQSGMTRNPVTGKSELMTTDYFDTPNDPRWADFWKMPTFNMWKVLDDVTKQRLLALRADPTGSLVTI